MKLAEIRERFLAFVRDEHQDRWKDPRANRALSDAEQFIARLLENHGGAMIRRSTTLAVPASPNDTVEFELPTNFRRLIRVARVDTTSSRLSTLEIGRFGELIGTAGYWLSDGEFYIQGRRIGFPNPPTSFTARVFYAPVFEPLADEEQEPMLDVEWHEAIAIRAAHIANDIDRPETPYVESLYPEMLQEIVNSATRRLSDEAQYVQADDR